tara:strand:- start:50 stop:352 length:303 start_codon:yes stop_codon:yes gene_type:complete
MKNVSFDFTILDEKSGESVFMLDRTFQNVMKQNGLFCDDYQVYVKTGDDVGLVCLLMGEWEERNNTPLDFRVSKCVDGVVEEMSFTDFQYYVQEYYESTK